MSDTVVISLERFAGNAEKIVKFLEADYIEYSPEAFCRAFEKYTGIVALMSAGIAVRKIAPLLKDKWVDPAVVVVSPDMRFSVPVSGGHHGANDLAKKLSGMGICPVITTATETAGKSSVEGIASAHEYEVLNKDSTRYVNASILDSDVPVHMINSPGIVMAGPGVSILVKKGEYVIGVGCRKGVSPEEVVSSIRNGLEDAGICEDEVLAYATTVKKRYEKGLLEAMEILSGNLVFLDDNTINMQNVKSASKATRLGLLGVAEPCALALSKKKDLIMEKKAYGKVTIAIAR
ncbi:cobalt-precorrin 5A hydrolase [Methanocella sp. CWC-04]|uniref:Cobalt-precorrin 5A hydrolase n=1 Tax=Methanooceanicella nereidis TaxID=2052831 RepID=A0AAP2RF34_9EURY|nr:cobalt-precorrin 5A hydrolase [Methanocella sp. CWC-04]MCD1295400.1 cobalt-precorrin 5A hydrolase [Methanocella sp. CWC-04]